MKIKSGLIVAMAAGSIAGTAQAEKVMVLDEWQGTAALQGTVYIAATGERIIHSGSYEQAFANRGANTFEWDLSVPDPCFPDSAGDENTDALYAWNSRLGSRDRGDEPTPNPEAINVLEGWFEHGGDVQLEAITVGYLSEVFDVDSDGDGFGDGADGHDLVMAFIEDSDVADSSNGVASFVFTGTGLPGALDADGNGEINPPTQLGFASTEVAVLSVTFELDTPVELGDTDGSTTGPQGADRDGDGLIDGQYAFTIRQPGVAEGDPLIARWPELGDLDGDGNPDLPGEGIVNPDGLDANTFGNVVNIGQLLSHPSTNAGIEGDPDCYENLSGAFDWPYNPGCDDMAPFPIGNEDAFGYIDSLGNDAGDTFWFGGFSCEDPGVGPYYTAAPWAGAFITFSAAEDPGPTGCNAADNSAPFGTLDLADVAGFVGDFPPNGPCTPGFGDIAGGTPDGPNGVCDLADVATFVQEFQAGCP